MAKSNTAALAARPFKGETRGKTYESMSVRPIDNGFIVSKTCEKDGCYTSSEKYSPTRPSMGDADDASAVPTSMSDAIKHLKGE